LFVFFNGKHLLCSKYSRIQFLKIIYFPESDFQEALKSFTKENTVVLSCFKAVVINLGLIEAEFSESISAVWQRSDAQFFLCVNKIYTMFKETFIFSFTKGPVNEGMKLVGFSTTDNC